MDTPNHLPATTTPESGLSHSPATTTLESGPRYRHEFVGMMFAVAIGEVGIRMAVLVSAHNWVHFLPAYSHLLLATVVIAASWVGWSRSPSPGARKDVQGVLEWEFAILLVDVILVIVYFILVSLVDYSGEETIQLNASATPEATWIIGIFWLYLLWDFLSKVIMYLKEERREPWLRNYGARFLPTFICLFLAYVIRCLVQNADAPHVLTADLALIGLVVFFRALKELVSALWPTSGKPSRGDKRLEDYKAKRNRAVRLSALWGFVILVGTLWTCFWPIPWVAGKILMTPAVQSTPFKNARPGQ